MSGPEQEQVRLAERLFVTIGRLRRKARQASGPAWPVGTVTDAQLELLRLVRREPGITVAQAAVALGVAPNTVSTLITRLTALAMLRRVQDPDDRRMARLQLAPQARRQADSWHDRRTTVAARALAELSPSSRAALARAVPAMVELAAAMEAAYDD